MFSSRAAARVGRDAGNPDVANPQSAKPTDFQLRRRRTLLSRACARFPDATADRCGGGGARLRIQRARRTFAAAAQAQRVQQRAEAQEDDGYAEETSSSDIAQAADDQRRQQDRQVCAYALSVLIRRFQRLLLELLPDAMTAAAPPSRSTNALRRLPAMTVSTCHCDVYPSL